ncbi:MAG: hypothetical protein JW871_07415 [Endomicrobiales bacterium]|nr:hypothetical protein [Endomicrobiales bacterium]
MNEKCVYCLKEKNSFNREHVIPQSFGTFGSNTFVLNHNEVCSACNEYFSKDLELSLGRDSIEGRLRFKENIKSEEEFKALTKNKRLIEKAHEEPFKGVYIEARYSEQLQRIEAIPLPQAGFLNKDNIFDYFLWSEIPTNEELVARGYQTDKKGSTRIFGVFDFEEINKKFAEKGFKYFKTEGMIDPDSTMTDISCEITECIGENKFKVMAKIAFNYFIYFKGKAICLSKDFDVIRNYIRYGNKPNYPLVIPKDKAILSDEPIAGMRRSGHIITVNKALDGISIVAQVSLMNYLSYSICLSRNCQETKNDIRRGHFFDPHNKQILELEVR